MFCQNCGKELNAGAKFCPGCGSPAGVMPGGMGEGMGGGGMPGGTRTAPSGGYYVTQNISLDPDGVYRWKYDFPLLRNPGMLVTLLKWMVLIVFLLYLFILAAQAFTAIGGLDMDDFKNLSLVFLCILAGMLVLSLLGYLLGAAIYGGSYKISFAMTQSELAYSQDSEQLKKTQGIAVIAAVGGAATGNFGAAGGALASVSRNRRDVWFHKVKRIKLQSRRNTIYLGIHPVYAEAADFAFVRDFIVPRCPKAKVTGQ